MPFCNFYECMSQMLERIRHWLCNYEGRNYRTVSHNSYSQRPFYEAT